MPGNQILIVEDEKRLAEIIQKQLLEYGFIADIANDGYVGKRMAEQTDYDLIILDINLPLLNGYELCKEIRKTKREIPIIMLTAFSTPDNKLAGFDAGADDYVLKPFDFRELILTTLSMLIMVLIGWQLTSLFLVSSGSKTIVSRDFRPFYIFVTVVLPWVIGGILLFILTSPKYYTPFELKTMTQGFMLLPSLFTYNSVHNDTSIALGVTKRKDLNWSVVIVSFMLLFLFRIFLNFGMRFHF